MHCRNKGVCLSVVAALAFAQAAFAGEPLLVLQGDGLTIRVLTMSEEEESVTGELVQGDKTYPMSGKMGSDGDVETVKGTFRVGEQSFPFVTTQRDGDETVTFASGGRQYRLRPAAPAGATAAPAPAASDVSLPANVPNVPQDLPANANDGAPRPPVAKSPAGLPDQVKLRKVEFRDINMGNVVAYTMLVPEGWNAEGHIEWSQDKTPYPQQKISVTAPDKSRINFMPAMSFSYMELTQPQFAMGMPAKQGEAPPENLGQWIVSKIQATNNQVTNVRLVDDQRDTATENMIAEMARQAGIATPGQSEIHIITITYDMDGVPFTELMNLNYMKNPPMITQNMNIWNWMLFTNHHVRAPSDKFEALKPLMLTCATSLQSVPKWWNQQQQLIMEITKQNHVIGMEEIRRRGQMYDQMSDAQMAAWKKSSAVSDSQQNDRINAINEVSDFRDPSGSNVKLPIHYKEYYTDGQGNYLMSNSPIQDSSSGWTKLEPVK